jgi:hypothetical protein
VTNFAPVAVETTVRIANPDRGRGLDYSNVTAPSATTPTSDGFSWTGTLSPVIPPQVTSIAPAAGPAGGYLPLSLFGIAPISGVGDDTITNFNVPAFMFGSESYNRIGVVSNGYLVIGGGTADDLVYVPQTFPNTARPNNVLAPYWTDLNPAAAGAVRIGTLTDGTSTWIVVDWAGVRNFSNATTHTFEIWIKIGTTAASEEITYSYGANGAGDPGSGTNWGAENRNGTSGKNIPTQPANGSEFRVFTSPPQAGGTITIAYDASAKKAGAYTSTAAMTSNVTPGTTQVVQAFLVTKAP